MAQFEFHAYGGDGTGDIASSAAVTYHQLPGITAARGKAGRLAKRIDGPVDIAFAGGAEWSERYITTAMPSEFHASGYRFERLD